MKFPRNIWKYEGIMKLLVSILPLLMLCCFTVNLGAQQKAPDYKIAGTYALPGEGGWDTLTAVGGMVYLSRGTVVQVVDGKTGKLAGTISGTSGVHGIALAPEFDKGFTSDGRSNCVTVFSLKTLTVLSRVPVTGTNPDAILYDAFSRQVFVFNGRTSNATVINAKDDTVVATIPLAGKPEFGVSDGNGTVYVNIEDKSLVSVIDAKTLKVTAKWPLAPGEEPSGIALDTAKGRLFSACDKMMVVLDTKRGAVVTNLPIGGRVDGAEFDPALMRAYAPSGDGFLTVIQETTNGGFELLGDVPTKKSARTIAIDVDTHHVYLPAAEFGETPKATAEHPHPRPAMKPGSFVLLDIAPGK
jgi:YVTN family beta-propeller protein